eukprot:144543_1
MVSQHSKAKYCGSTAPLLQQKRKNTQKMQNRKTMNNKFITIIKTNLILIIITYIWYWYNFTTINTNLILVTITYIWYISSIIMIDWICSIIKCYKLMRWSIYNIIWSNMMITWYKSIKNWSISSTWCRNSINWNIFSINWYNFSISRNTFIYKWSSVIGVIGLASSIDKSLYFPLATLHSNTNIINYKNSKSMIKTTGPGSKSLQHQLSSGSANIAARKANLISNPIKITLILYHYYIKLV